MYRQRYRTIWLSDIHLGSRACRIELLAGFLAVTDCERLYLVGDIIDLERMRRSFYWPQSHSDVLRTILDMSRRGTQVVYIPGNHDDDFRALAGARFGNIEVAERCIHVTADGRRLLVLHGDEFDGLIRSRGLTAVAGSIAYGALLTLNRVVHAACSALRRPYWSLAQNVKLRIGRARRYIDRFQRACLAAARDAAADGVVCGHIHKAELRIRDGLLYCNDGDWVESCSALTEDSTGRLALLHVAASADGATTAAGIAALRDAA